MLQQYLPFTVLKHRNFHVLMVRNIKVATVLTVYGIETVQHRAPPLISHCTVATVLTVYGIETHHILLLAIFQRVATVLTVYGIETRILIRIL